MKRFFSPLIYFIVGMLGLAVLTLFFPAIHTQTTQAEARIGPTVESHYWGLHWAMSSTRLLIFVIIFLIIIFTVGVIWIKRKWGKNQ
jgi:hypothetical protein